MASGLNGPFFVSGRCMDLQALLDKTLQALGYELVLLELSNRGQMIRLFIDREGGVTIDDCTLVSNHVSRLLAVELDYDYDRLEVSSPGLDRPLTKEADYQRFNGERVQLRLRVPRDGQRKFLGVLRDMKDGAVQVEVDGALMAFDMANIEKARLVPNV